MADFRRFPNHADYSGTDERDRQGSGMDFLCLNTRDMKTMMIISAMEEVTSVSFFICRALYTPTEGPPKYSATNWGYSFSAFCSSFSISRMSLSFLPVLPVLNTGVVESTEYTDLRKLGHPCEEHETGVVVGTFESGVERFQYVPIFLFQRSIQYVQYRFVIFVNEHYGFAVLRRRNWNIILPNPSDGWRRNTSVP
jgi:hypothetical protein